MYVFFSVQMLAAAQCQTSSPKNQTAQNRGTDVRDDIPQDIPEIDRNHVPLWPDHGNDICDGTR